MKRKQTYTPVLPIDLFNILVAGIIILLSSLIAIGLWIAHKPRPIEIVVPRTELPAYHLIRPGDLITTTIEPQKLSTEVLTTQKDLVGRFSMSKLKAYSLVMNSNTITANTVYNLDKSLVVSVPIPLSMALAGSIQPGDHIDLYTTSLITSTYQPLVIPIGEDILVLDVKEIDSSSKTPENITLVLVLPIINHNALLIASKQGHIIVSKPANR